MASSLFFRLMVSRTLRSAVRAPASCFMAWIVASMPLFSRRRMLSSARMETSCLSPSCLKETSSAMEVESRPWALRRGRRLFCCTDWWMERQRGWWRGERSVTRELVLRRQCLRRAKGEFCYMIIGSHWIIPKSSMFLLTCSYTVTTSTSFRQLIVLLYSLNSTFSRSVSQCSSRPMLSFFMPPCRQSPSSTRYTPGPNQFCCGRISPSKICCARSNSNTLTLLFIEISRLDPPRMIRALRYMALSQSITLRQQAQWRQQGRYWGWAQSWGRPCFQTCQRKATKGCLKWISPKKSVSQATQRIVGIMKFQSLKRQLRQMGRQTVTEKTRKLRIRTLQYQSQTLSWLQECGSRGQGTKSSMLRTRTQRVRTAMISIVNEYLQSTRWDTQMQSEKMLKVMKANSRKESMQMHFFCSRLFTNRKSRPRSPSPEIARLIPTPIASSRRSPRKRARIQLITGPLPVEKTIESLRQRRKQVMRMRNLKKPYKPSRKRAAKESGQGLMMNWRMRVAMRTRLQKMQERVRRQERWAIWQRVRLKQVQTPQNRYAAVASAPTITDSASPQAIKLWDQPTPTTPTSPSSPRRLSGSTTTSRPSGAFASSRTSCIPCAAKGSYSSWRASPPGSAGFSASSTSCRPWTSSILSSNSCTMTLMKLSSCSPCLGSTRSWPND